ncbi:hypothetical protein H2203_005253, partial [Taxawa tesnikishii (nom. ined.)]
MAVALEVRVPADLTTTGMDLTRQQTKEKLLKNLKEYAELSDKDLDLFRYAVISSDYFTRYDHR